MRDGRARSALAILAALVAWTGVGEGAHAADFNGDGRDDLIVGSYREGLTDPYADEGTVDVLYGARRKLPAGGALEINESMGWLKTNGPRHGEQFGRFVGAGDFDGNGRDDLVIGNRFESIEVAGDRINDAGAAHVVYGGRHGLKRRSAEQIDQQRLGVADGPQYSDLFGQGLASGDFDGDGYEELAVGAPGEDLDESESEGIVHVIAGSRKGLRPKRTRSIDSLLPKLEAPGRTRSEAFGFTLAAGDFDGDGYDDLVIGTDDGIDGDNDAGAIHVIPGSRKGLVVRKSRYLHESSPGVKGPGAGFQRDFSNALSVGDYDGDGRDDLAVGVPQADETEGAVHIFGGSRRGLSSRHDRYLTPSEPGMAEGEPRSGRWGTSLASGDLDGDGRDDLAVGTQIGANISACVGEVRVLFGTRKGILKRHNQAITQTTPGIRGDGEVRECDLFGITVAIHDLDGRGPEELAIGEPQNVREQDYGQEYGVGGVHLLYPNRKRNLTARGYRYITQGTPGIPGDGPELRDSFGVGLG